MIHYNLRQPILKIYHFKEKQRVGAPYGVSHTARIISPQALLKKHSQVRSFLSNYLSLTAKQKDIVLVLLRFWSYYGSVYLKEKQMSELAGCSKPTFWRTIAALRDMKLLGVVNRYLRRPQAQISNVYILDALVKCLAEYFARFGISLHIPSKAEIRSRVETLYWRLVAETQAHAPPLAQSQ